MTDIFTREKRSEIMSRIRSKDTKIELAIKPIFEMAGFEYHPEGIFGNPDMAHRSAKVAVFLRGCFWHGCPIHFRLPKTNREFWRRKIERNIQRDREVVRELRRLGWLVVMIWEHDVPRSLLKGVKK